jgi:hypothetical protein
MAWPVQESRSFPGSSVGSKSRLSQRMEASLVLDSPCVCGPSLTQLISTEFPHGHDTADCCVWSLTFHSSRSGLYESVCRVG